MNIDDNNFYRLIKLIGGQRCMARILGYSISKVSRLLTGDNKPEAGCLLHIEKKTEGLIGREELTPALFKGFTRNKPLEVVDRREKVKKLRAKYGLDVVKDYHNFNDEE